MAQIPQATHTVASLVAEAAARGEALDPRQFAVEAGRPDTVVVDVREPDEVRSVGRIRGSAAIPRGLLELSTDPASAHHRTELSRDRRVLLCCSDGQRSILAAASLVMLGYRDVAYLDGGITAWHEASLPLDGAVPVMTAEDYDALRNVSPTTTIAHS